MLLELFFAIAISHYPVRNYQIRKFRRGLRGSAVNKGSPAALLQHVRLGHGCDSQTLHGSSAVLAGFKQYFRIVEVSRRSYDGAGADLSLGRGSKVDGVAHEDA